MRFTITDDWILDAMRSGAVTSRDLTECYERSIGIKLGYNDGQHIRAWMNRRLHVLQGRGLVDTVGICEISGVKYNAWMVI